MTKVQLAVRCEKADIKILKEFAESDNRSFSNYVNDVLIKHIGEKTDYRDKTDYRNEEYKAGML